MNIQKFFVISLALLITLSVPASASCQEDVTKAQSHRDASIHRMQKRVAEIESEMKDAETSHAQALGEEAFNLFGQIDQTFLQMKNAYQQQVIVLNERMQRKWEEVESTELGDREAINDALLELEKDWDKTFERLTKAHKSHLDQLNDRLAKLNGEFSTAAGKAQAELEASNFEAKSRWEEGHELFLAINRTYVKIVEGQLGWQQDEAARNPADTSMAQRLVKTRVRYANTQKRFRRRLAGHLEHLDEELSIRLKQLSATNVWDTRREIMSMVDGLYARKHVTFEHLQSSYRETASAIAAEMREVKSDSERYAQLTENIKTTKSDLSGSYLARIDFIAAQISDLESRIKIGASVEEKAKWTAKMTNLRLLSRSLKVKSIELVVPPVRTVHR